MIIEKSGIKYHHTLTYTLCILRKWGFRQKVPRKVHVNIQHPRKRKMLSKKDTEQILVDKHIQQHQQNEEKKGFTLVSIDESVFFMILLCKKGLD
jgi:hypothetical protein